MPWDHRFGLKPTDVITTPQPNTSMFLKGSSVRSSMQFLPSIPQARQWWMCNYFSPRELFLLVSFLQPFLMNPFFSLPSNSIFLPCFKWIDAIIWPHFCTPTCCCQRSEGQQMCSWKSCSWGLCSSSISLKRGRNLVWKMPQSTHLTPTFMWGAAWKRFWEGDSQATGRLCAQRQRQSRAFTLLTVPWERDCMCYNEEGTLC